MLSDLSDFGFESKVDRDVIVQTHEATGYSFQLFEEQKYNKVLKSAIASPADSRAIGYRPLREGLVKDFLPSDLKVLCYN